MFNQSKADTSSKKNLALAYVKEFCKDTTLHGLSHLVKPGRHWFEVLFWALMVSGSVASAIGLTYRSWSRYHKSPVIIAMDKAFRKWNTSLPGSTLCYVNKLNETKAIEIIKRDWQVESGEKFNYYMKFLQTVTNSSYYNLNDFKEFMTDPNLNSANLAQLMEEVNFSLRNYTLAIFGVAKKNFTFHETLTEMGICYSYNSFITPYLPPGGRTYKPQKLHEVPISPQCNVLNPLCTGRITNFERSAWFYIHSSYELPDSTSRRHSVEKKYNIENTFRFLTIAASPSLRHLDIQQRKCNFPDESRSGGSPFYSYQLCKMDCRRHLCMSLCKCVPHFYVKQKNQPYCDLRGLVCLSQQVDFIVQLINKDGEKYKCPCYTSCSETNYFLDNTEIYHWKKSILRGYGYEWKIALFSKKNLKREIIYGIEDVIVSLGGIAGFFLGCSLLTGTEVIYFCTLRLIRYMWRASKKKTSTVRKSLLRTKYAGYSNACHLTIRKIVKVKEKRMLKPNTLEAPTASAKVKFLRRSRKVVGKFVWPDEEDRSLVNGENFVKKKTAEHGTGEEGGISFPEKDIRNVLNVIE